MWAIKRWEEPKSPVTLHSISLDAFIPFLLLSPEKGLMCPWQISHTKGYIPPFTEYKEAKIHRLFRYQNLNQQVIEYF